MTKAQMFAVVKGIVKDYAYENDDVTFGEDNEITAYDVLSFLDNEIELVNKRNSRKGTNKKTEANKAVKEAIVEVLEGSDKALTVTEITKTDTIQAFSTEDKPVSNAKITALLTQLRKDGLVKREYDKKVAYFSLGKEEDEDTPEE